MAPLLCVFVNNNKNGSSSLCFRYLLNPSFEQTSIIEVLLPEQEGAHVYSTMYVLGLVFIFCVPGSDSGQKY
jgi:hypothetical protein